MKGGRGRLLAIAGVVFGLMWLVAAVAKVLSPIAAYQFATHAVPAGVPAKPAIAAIVAGEALLGAAMCLRAVRGLGWSLAGLLAMSVVILVLRAGDPAELLQCGCFGSLFGTQTLEGALVRNAALIAVHVALMLWSRRLAAAATPTS